MLETVLNKKTLQVVTVRFVRIIYQFKVQEREERLWVLFFNMEKYKYKKIKI